MPDEEQFFTESIKKVEQYVQDRLLLLKLQTAAKVSKLSALLFSGLVIALLSFFILFFLSIMAGYFFAELTHSLYAGFGIVTGFYILLLIIIIALRKNNIEKFVTNTVIKVFFDNDNDDDE